MSRSRTLVAPPNALSSGSSRIHGLLGGIAVVFIYIGLFLRDYFVASELPTVPAAFFAIGLTVGVVPSVIRSTTSGHASHYVIVAAAISWWLLLLAANGGPVIASYVSGVICAFIIANSAPTLFIRILGLHLGISIAIQVSEYFSQEYFFVVTTEEGIDLDSEFFGGARGVFRAKGLFPGALSTVAFAYWIAFVNRRSLLATLGLLVSSYLAVGRLGIFIGALILFWRMGGRKLSMRHWALMLIPVVAMYVLLPADKATIEFITLTFDPGSSNNLARVFFWKASLSEYLNYDGFAQLIGRYGYIKGIGLFTESDFLQLLLDYGLLGLTAYVLAVARLLVLCLRRHDREGLFTLCLIVALMTVFPFVQSLFSATLFWLYYFLYERNCLSDPERQPVRRLAVQKAAAIAPHAESGVSFAP